MQTAIISVGTELTVGQIINRNSAWISAKLKELGVATRSHLVVPDEHELILEALRFSAERCDTFFVTGGLGPTTDDFTRDLIAEWTGLPLEFHEPSWEHVNQRLKSRGLQVRESQKQQCLFPKGATVLTNPEGTANGFFLKALGKEIYVLPGPPREIEAIWNEHIAPILAEKTKNLDRTVTYSWDTMGLGESDVAHLCEQALAGVEIEKGYRVHLPYVEAKISFFESQQKDMMKWVDKLNEALHHITVTRNGEDVADLLAKKLSAVCKLEVVDALSGPVLNQRLTAALRGYMASNFWSITNHEGAEADPLTLKLVLKPWDATSAIAEIHFKGGSFKTTFEAPFMISKMTERKALFFTERALIFWLQKIEDLV